MRRLVVAGWLQVATIKSIGETVYSGADCGFCGADGGLTCGLGCAGTPRGGAEDRLGLTFTVRVRVC